MIVERTENPQWLSNAYLVADEAGGKGVLIDGNDDLGPLLERAEQDGIEITHILITHPHGDHIAGLAAAQERLGDVPMVAHAEALGEIEDEVAETIADGETLSTGDLEIEAISTPGHAAGHKRHRRRAPGHRHSRGGVRSAVRDRPDGVCSRRGRGDVLPAGNHACPNALANRARRRQTPAAPGVLKEVRP